MSEAAECRSNVDCPGNSSQCVVNCSAVAVNTFNQPASHGNCRISINSEGYVVQDCYIHECSTSHPDLCVPESALGDDAVSCCCTEDECNSNFSFPPEDPKNSTGVSYLFILSAYVLCTVLLNFYSCSTWTKKWATLIFHIPYSCRTR